MDHNGADGVSLVTGSTATIIGNTLRANDSDGMALLLASHAEVTGNVIKNNATEGIRLFGNSSGIMTDNVIEDNGRNGVSIQSGSTAELSGNTIDRSGIWGILLGLSSATITDNRISNANRHCILVWRSSEAMMTNNSLTGCQAGVVVMRESSAEIVNNTITSHITEGVTIHSWSAATLAGNTLSDSPVGLLVQGETSSATLRGGIITSTSHAAVSLIGGTTLEMSLDSPDTLHLVDNSGVGLLVADDASRVEFDSERTRFVANGGGDIQGRGTIVDVADADSDGDGLSDSFERRYGFDRLTPGDGAADSDGDGLSNPDEQLARTDPRLADSDGDGLGDGEETMLAGRNPLNPNDAAAVVDLVSNGGFEAVGDNCTRLPVWTAGEDCLPGWRQVSKNRSVEIPGSWLPLQGTTSTLVENRVPPPPEGNVAAIAESPAGDSALLLLQAIDIPPAASVVLGADVLVLSGMPFVTPEGFDLVVDPDSDLPLLNHQFRIDLLDPEASDQAVGDEVLAPLFRTEEGSAPIVDYRRLLFDLTPYAGQRVVLRFAHQQEVYVLVSVVDNVRVLASGGAP